jgi:hypothetical protein
MTMTDLVAIQHMYPEDARVGRLVGITTRKAIVETELIVGGSTTATGSTILVRLSDEWVSHPDEGARPIFCAEG